ncbi:DNA-binding protein [Streptomyces sp. NPDC004787]|uniref:DNA-binding protein n=1 Tax=Streptomyces sp. NPDC004787 TaxID=3154291 RepID=UPI0033AFB956
MPRKQNAATTQPTLADIRKWPATVPVPQAARAIGCSGQHLRDRIKRGDAPVKTIQLGTRYVVITADLLRLLSGADESEAA